MNQGNSSSTSKDSKPLVSVRYTLEEGDSSVRDKSQISNSLVSSLLLLDSNSRPDTPPTHLRLQNSSSPGLDFCQEGDYTGSQVEDLLERDQDFGDGLLSSRMYEGDLNDYLQAPSKNEEQKTSMQLSCRVKYFQIDS